MIACSKCDTPTPPDGFYARDQMCKGCRKALVRAYRLANLFRIQAYDRARGQTPKRKAYNRKWYRKHISTPEGRTTEREKKRAYINSNKRAANIIVNNAIHDGRLIRQSCEQCNSNECVHGHHEDYTKPLDVIWLCPPCHGKRHREINEERRIT